MSSIYQDFQRGYKKVLERQPSPQIDKIKQEYQEIMESTLSLTQEEYLPFLVKLFVDSVFVDAKNLHLDVKSQYGILFITVSDNANYKVKFTTAEDAYPSVMRTLPERVRRTKLQEDESRIYLATGPRLSWVKDDMAKLEDSICSDRLQDAMEGKQLKPWDYYFAKSPEAD